MKLYHATYGYLKDEIEKGGYISNTEKGSDCTEMIDELLTKIQGTNPRKNCIYLTDDFESTSCYDYAYGISIKRLNTKLLYVADYGISQKLYDEMMQEEKDNYTIIKLAKDYIYSIVPYSIYVESGMKYECAEFLYFDRIKVSEDNLAY